MTKKKFNPGDKFILEIGEKRMALDEYEIVGTDLWVWGSLLEKLTPYEPDHNVEISKKVGDDLISRRADDREERCEQNCVLTVWGECSYAETGCSDCEIKARITKALLPSAQPDVPDTNVGDTISRQAAIDIVVFECDKWTGLAKEISKQLRQLPSAQPEPISEAYAKAVMTWLVQYQIKCAELQGRYTPYEVLGWIVNDWRKDNGIDGINQ